jgi:Zn-finger nucleic acid-binding protein
MLRGARCPRCELDMLAIAPDAGSVVHACPRCHGLFVPPLAWDYLLTHPERVDELEAKLPPAPASPAELLPRVRCPACTAEMDRLRFAVTSDVVMDTCIATHGSWLDAGELGAIVRFLRDTAADPTHEEKRRAAEFRDQMERAAAEWRLAQHATAARQREQAAAPPQPAWRNVLVAIALLVLLSAFGARCSYSSSSSQDESSE